jgi:predicted TIM-barrel fold metal-dependent hydrolase
MECGMIFDFRTFAGYSFDGASQTVSDLLRSMDAVGIDRALVCPFKPLSYNLEQANRELAGAIRGHEDRLTRAARIDPWQPDAVDALTRAFESFGSRALYLNPWEEHFRADLERLDPLMAVAHAHSAPVLVASGYPWLSEALQVCRLAQRWPDTPVVMTNGGQFNISGLGQADATLALSKAPNLLIDTAGVYRQDFIEETAEAFGCERVLFGSGAPYFDQHFEIKRIMMAKVPLAARRTMQAGNALRLLDPDVLNKLKIAIHQP